MKEKDAYIDYKPHQLILYVEKEDGSYGSYQTGSYIAKNFLDDFWLKRRHLQESLVKELKDGKISHVGFYMTLEELSVAELASRVRISTARVKKHLKPFHFGKISLPLLSRYAEVFDVPLSNMFQIIVTGREDLKVKQEKTNTPLVVVTKIEEKEK